MQWDLQGVCRESFRMTHGGVVGCQHCRLCRGRSIACAFQNVSARLDETFHRIFPVEMLDQVPRSRDLCLTCVALCMPELPEMPSISVTRVQTETRDRRYNQKACGQVELLASMRSHSRFRCSILYAVLILFSAHAREARR